MDPQKTSARSSPGDGGGKQTPASGATAGWRPSGRSIVVAVPYLWLVALFLVPFLIVFKISLSETAIAQPPYLPVFDPAAGWQGLREYLAGLSFSNYLTLAGDDLYVLSYLKSLKVAALSTVMLVIVRFSDRLCDGACAKSLAAGSRRADHAAVLDLFPDPGLCLDQYSPARRAAQPGALWRRHSSIGRDVARDRYRGLYRSRLFLSAVHGAAALCEPRETRRQLAGSRRGSWLSPLEGIFRRDGAAGAAGSRGRRAVVLHPDRRRVRRSGSARRLRHDDDRPDAVDGVFRQQRLAGRVCGRGRAGRAAGSADRLLSAPAIAQSRRAEDGTSAVLDQSICARSRARVSLRADRDPRHLFVQRFAPRHGMGRLVDPLVRGTPRRPRHDRCGARVARHRVLSRQRQRRYSERSRRSR